MGSALDKFSAFQTRIATDRGPIVAAHRYYSYKIWACTTDRKRPPKGHATGHDPHRNRPMTAANRTKFQLVSLACSTLRCSRETRMWMKRRRFEFETARLFGLKILLELLDAKNMGGVSLCSDRGVSLIWRRINSTLKLDWFAIFGSTKERERIVRCRL